MRNRKRPYLKLHFFKGLLHYRVNDPNKKWSDIFREIEEIKQTHSIIEDYSISETSLEDVFLSVAQEGESDSHCKEI